MPRCPSCGAEVDEEDRYCPYCGYPLKKEPKDKTPLVIVVTGVIIAIIIIAFAFSSSIGHQSIQGPPKKSCYYTTITTYNTITKWITTQTPTKVRLIDAKVIVKPGYYRYYSLHFDTETTLYGYFIAEGGLGDDIWVVLYTEIGFTNFQKGHPLTRFYYFSGKVTTDRFMVTIPPGDYYLVLDNTFSIFSNKVVTIQVDAEWLETTTYPIEQVEPQVSVQYVCE